MVRVEPDGTVRASIGDPPSGQSYETVIAQIVADELGLTPDAVTVDRGFDSTTTPWLYLSGNYSNKFSVTDVGAVVGAAARVRRSSCASPRTGSRSTWPTSSCGMAPRSSAAHLTGGSRSPSWRGRPMRTCSAAAGGGAGTRGAARAPESARPAPRRRPPRALAARVLECRALLSRGGGPAHRLREDLKYVVVHDCGREMHRLIVEGMVHGSTVHGIGAALLEEFRYDETGQLLTSTFMDYLKPTSADVPAIEVDRLEHPSPFTPLGAKGVGEGGAIPGPRPSPTPSRMRSRRSAR